MPTAKEDENWVLGVDAQASTLVQLKQQLTYFLITGSTATIGFVTAIANGRTGGWEAAVARPTVFAFAALSLAGLGCAGLCLLYLYFGNQSFVLQVKYRYERKENEDLSANEQRSWDNLTSRSNRFLEISFLLLFIEIVAAVVFFWLLIANTGAPPPPLPTDN